MSSQWVNKYAIMRDLSVMQGCVPVAVADTVAAGDRPPSPDFLEETEEEFYRNHVGSDGDFGAPDLQLIRQMLDMVKDYDCSSDLEIELESDDSIDIIEPDPPSAEVSDPPSSEVIQLKTKIDKASESPTLASESPTINCKSPTMTSESPTITRPRRQRNAAIASLLLNLESKRAEAVCFIEDPRLDVVRLPQHRHTLKGQCVVCNIMAKSQNKNLTAV